MSNFNAEDIQSLQKAFENWKLNALFQKAFWIWKLITLFQKLMEQNTNMIEYISEQNTQIAKQSNKLYTVEQRLTDVLRIIKCHVPELDLTEFYRIEQSSDDSKQESLGQEHQEHEKEKVLNQNQRLGKRIQKLEKRIQNLEKQNTVLVKYSDEQYTEIVVQSIELKNLKQQLNDALDIIKNHNLESILYEFDEYIKNIE